MKDFFNKYKWPIIIVTILVIVIVVLLILYFRKKSGSDVIPPGAVVTTNPAEFKQGQPIVATTAVPYYEYSSLGSEAPVRGSIPSGKVVTFNGANIGAGWIQLVNIDSSIPGEFIYTAYSTSLFKGEKK